MKRLPTYFISHGGGPWPWLDGEYRRQYDRLEASLQGVAREVGTKPRAILVISGHWEEDRFTVQSGEKPGMIYDYGGFPEHTYRIRYASPGSPGVARRVQELLSQSGIEVALDAERGYDHGTYTPLYSMYPEADVPVLQLSILRSYDPEAHLALGRALAPLRDEGVLIVASGLSFHNLRRFGPAARAPSEAFDGWLARTMDASPAERSHSLREWEKAPAARVAHPQEDHFIPLLVAVGAAEEEAAQRVYHEQGFMGGVTASSYRIGELSPERALQ
ncbi:MAG TPA: class III extradiol ring-cleavage dioxygenase [Usitatibacter sp.]|nr:class III extradiol ring-cleavage dioxygenase [Usitatibacter sp.]